jgi:release factor glutamine methyltransferase
MLIKQYKIFFTESLSKIYDLKEIESFFFIILENKHKLKRIDLALNIDLQFSEAKIIEWDSILEQLKKEIPIQYILGETEFFGLRLEVDNSVLIPRPETEELVEWIIEEESKVKSQKSTILDIGTGSGCIAISLAKNISNAQVYAIDVSEKALAVAQKNSQINKVDVNFISLNILEVSSLNSLNFFNPKPETRNLKLETKFDIIVSNPPYVRNLEKAEINKNVLDNEPHLALFVEDNDALLFYRKIADLAKKSLSENGQLYFEINQYLGKETVGLLEDLGFKNIVLKKDIYGNDRMIKCTRYKIRGTK